MNEEDQENVSKKLLGRKLIRRRPPPATGITDDDTAASELDDAAIPTRSRTGSPVVGGRKLPQKKDTDSKMIKKPRKRSPLCFDHITVLGGNPTIYQCNICKSKFKTKANIHYHDIKCRTGDWPFICKTCGKGYITKGHFDYHVGTHTGKKPFACPKCRKRFRQQSKVNRHMRTHTGEKPFVCQECDRGFANAQALKCHTMIHTGERPFPCPQCEKRFTGGTNLKKHLVTHTGERPFSCPQPECGKRFGVKWSLDLHMKTHSGERPHTCDQCSRAFSIRKDLKRHLVIHSGVRPFKCVTCGTAFRRKDNLERHIRATHAQPREVAKQQGNEAAADYLKKNFKTRPTGHIPFSKVNSIVITHVIKNSDLKSAGKKTKKRKHESGHEKEEPLHEDKKQELIRVPAPAPPPVQVDDEEVGEEEIRMELETPPEPVGPAPQPHKEKTTLPVCFDSEVGHPVLVLVTPKSPKCLVGDEVETRTEDCDMGGETAQEEEEGQVGLDCKLPDGMDKEEEDERVVIASNRAVQSSSVPLEEAMEVEETAGSQVNHTQIKLVKEKEELVQKENMTEMMEETVDELPSVSPQPSELFEDDDDDESSFEDDWIDLSQHEKDVSLMENGAVADPATATEVADGEPDRVCNPVLGDEEDKHSKATSPPEEDENIADKNKVRALLIDMMTKLGLIRMLEMNRGTQTELNQMPCLSEQLRETQTEKAESAMAMEMDAGERPMTRKEEEENKEAFCTILCDIVEESIAGVETNRGTQTEATLFSDKIAGRPSKPTELVRVRREHEKELNNREAKDGQVADGNLTLPQELEKDQSSCPRPVSMPQEMKAMEMETGVKMNQKEIALEGGLAQKRNEMVEEDTQTVTESVTATDLGVDNNEPEGMCHSPLTPPESPELPAVTSSKANHIVEEVEASGTPDCEMGGETSQGEEKDQVAECMLPDDNDNDQRDLAASYGSAEPGLAPPQNAMEMGTDSPISQEQEELVQNGNGLVVEMDGERRSPVSRKSTAVEERLPPVGPQSPESFDNYCEDPRFEPAWIEVGLLQNAKIVSVLDTRTGTESAGTTGMDEHEPEKMPICSPVTVCSEPPSPPRKDEQGLDFTKDGTQLMILMKESIVVLEMEGDIPMETIPFLPEKLTKEGTELVVVREKEGKLNEEEEDGQADDNNLILPQVEHDQVVEMIVPVSEHNNGIECAEVTEAPITTESQLMASPQHTSSSTQEDKNVSAVETQTVTGSAMELDDDENEPMCITILDDDEEEEKEEKIGKAECSKPASPPSKDAGGNGNENEDSTQQCKRINIVEEDEDDHADDNHLTLPQEEADEDDEEGEVVEQDMEEEEEQESAMGMEVDDGEPETPITEEEQEEVGRDGCSESASPPREDEVDREEDTQQHKRIDIVVEKESLAQPTFLYELVSEDELSENEGDDQADDINLTLPQEEDGDHEERQGEVQEKEVQSSSIHEKTVSVGGTEALTESAMAATAMDDGGLEGMYRPITPEEHAMEEEEVGGDECSEPASPPQEEEDEVDMNEDGTQLMVVTKATTSVEKEGDIQVDQDDDSNLNLPQQVEKEPGSVPLDKAMETVSQIGQNELALEEKEILQKRNEMVEEMSIPQSRSSATVEELLPISPEQPKPFDNADKVPGFEAGEMQLLQNGNGVSGMESESGTEAAKATEMDDDEPERMYTPILDSQAEGTFLSKKLTKPPALVMESEDEAELNEMEEKNDQADYSNLTLPQVEDEEDHEGTEVVEQGMEEEEVEEQEKEIVPEPNNEIEIASVTISSTQEDQNVSAVDTQTVTASAMEMDVDEDERMCSPITLEEDNEQKETTAEELPPASPQRPELFDNSDDEEPSFEADGIALSENGKDVSAIETESAMATEMEDVEPQRMCSSVTLDEDEMMDEEEEDESEEDEKEEDDFNEGSPRQQQELINFRRNHQPLRDISGNSSALSNLNNNNNRYMADGGVVHSGIQPLRTQHQTETGWRPYSCTNCGKGFNEEAHLDKHVRITHTGVRPFGCPHCGKSFGLQMTLDFHLRSHSYSSTRRNVLPNFFN